MESTGDNGAAGQNVGDDYPKHRQNWFYALDLARIRALPDDKAFWERESQAFLKLVPETLDVAPPRVDIPRDLRIPIMLLRPALLKAWCRETSADPDGWSESNPAWGQCAVTELVVRDVVGGDLVWAEAQLPDGRRISHYWNRVQGQDIDLTREQFPTGTVVPEGGLRRADITDTAAYVMSFPVTAERYRVVRGVI